MPAFISVRPFYFKAAAIALTLLHSVPAFAQNANIVVDASRVMNKIGNDLYGSCIEDVNHEIYGGLYDQRIFGESFEEPAPPMNFEGWKTLGGDWKLSGKGVAVSTGPGFKLVKNMPVLKDGTLEADINIKEGFNAGLLVRVSNESTGADNFDGYEISLNPSAQTVILGKHIQNWKPLTEASISFKAAERVHLKVVMQGPRLLVYFNNAASPSIDYLDKEAPLLNGKIGLRTYNATVVFQNVIINNSSTSIKNGSPTLKTEFKAKNVLNISSAWDAIETGTKGSFTLDDTKAFNGKQAQVIQRRAGTGKTGVANLGLNRWGIAVRKNQKFEGRVYLNAEQLSGPVTVALQSADGNKTYATYKITRVTPDWKKYAFALTSNITDPKARFAIYIENAGKLRIDQAVLMSTGQDQFKGLPLRADIAAKMQQEGLTFLRYGGTMVNAPGYRWKKMIGDRDKRPPYKGHWYPYSTNGFGIEDFVKYCEAAGFEPAFAINIEETPQDAADMVEYLKGDISTFWGKKRAENGHPAPYKVRHIEIGNEEVINGDLTDGYNHYIERFNILYDAIHAKDPSIKLINSAWWRPESPNMERVFKALNGKAAYWDLHTDADPARAGTTVDKNLTGMQELFLKWDPNTAMKCTIFEENGGLHNMQRALGHATTLNAVRRHGDFVLTSCPANALQALGQNDNGWDQGQIFFTPSQVWGMPPFYAQQMAAKNHQPLRVFNTAEGDLDVTATKSEDGNMLTLHIVNPAAVNTTASLSINAFSARKSEVKIYTLAGAPKAENTPEQPEKIITKETTVQLSGDKIEYSFPASSYTILNFKK